jgi:hypothetical protein
MDYVSIDVLIGIAERWGQMTKKQIAKELKLSLKELNDYAYKMANGVYGDEYELPQTKKYGPYDERQDIDIKVGKKVYPIRVPNCEWPKRKADIQDEIEEALSVVTSDVLFVGSVIYHAKAHNLRQKKEYLKKWQKVIDSVMDLRELNC